MVDSNAAANIKDKIETGNRTGWLTQEELQRLLSDQETAAYMKHMILNLRAAST